MKMKYRRKRGKRKRERKKREMRVTERRGWVCVTRGRAEEEKS